MLNISMSLYNENRCKNSDYIKKNTSDLHSIGINSHYNDKLNGFFYIPNMSLTVCTNNLFYVNNPQNEIIANNYRYLTHPDF